MNNKIWIIKFFLINILVIGTIEIIYNFYPINRHYVDYIVNDILPNTKNKKVDILLLGDSVAANALSSKQLKDAIFDLTSNQAISMAGNYFLLKKFLKQNNPPKELFLFTVPEFYQNDLNQIWTYLYFETVFKNNEEIKEIQKIKPNLYLSENNLDKYFETRKGAFISIFKNFRNIRIKHSMLNKTEIKNDLNFISEIVTSKSENFKKNYNDILDIPIIYFDKINELCKENNIKFNIVIEPSPQRILNMFYSSNWYNYLTKSNIKLYDINSFYKFSDIHFEDGTHISGKVNDYYLQLVDENIINLIENKKEEYK